MSVAIVGLGSNLGDREQSLRQAIQSLEVHPLIHSVLASSYYATEPVGGPTGQPGFLNAAARLETSLEPVDLLTVLQQIETEAGRTRDIHWDARVLDLDLLLYDQCELHSPVLTVPHRLFPFRRFALEPVAEIAPEMLVPPLNWSVQRLFDHLRTAAPRFVICGCDPALGENVRDELASVLTETAAELVVIEDSRDAAITTNAKAVFWFTSATDSAELALEQAKLCRLLSLPVLPLPLNDLPAATRDISAVLKSMR